MARVVVPYYCSLCKAKFNITCSVPDMMPHNTQCTGIMSYSGTTGKKLLYMCSVCGNTQSIHISDAIPAMAQMRCRCGEACAI